MIRDDLPASYLLCSILTVPMAIDIAQVREMLSVRAADDTQLQVMRLEQLAAFSGHAASVIDEKLLRLAAFPDSASDQLTWSDHRKQQHSTVQPAAADPFSHSHPFDRIDPDLSGPVLLHP